ncbi:hypothetical protein S83_033864 [Arachis hypogaea]
MAFYNMFFKVLIDPNQLRENQPKWKKPSTLHELEIPPKFVEKNWKKLSNPLLLELPTGDKTEVKWVKKKNNSVWLNEGWRRVVELLKLKHGCFVTFKYNGKSKFELMVFHPNTLEIDYSSVRGFYNDDHHQGANENDDDGGDDDDDSIEIIAEEPEQFNNRSREGTCKSMLKEVHENHDYIVIDDDDDDDEWHSKPLLMRKRTKTKGTSKSILKKVRRNMKCDDNRSKALERAEAISSKLKNPSFVRDLKRSYVDYGIMQIPCSFSEQYLYRLKGSGTIWVSDNEDIKWSIKYSYSDSQNRTSIYGDWHKFRKENELEVGDVCVFEMMTEVEPVSFKIYIIRVRQESSSSYPHQFQESERPNRQANNQFELLITKSKLKASTLLKIPRKFIRQNERCVGKDVTLKVGKELWTVKVLNSGSFCKGWIQFARECKLVVGDICHFELTDPTNFVFHVSISREEHGS